MDGARIPMHSIFDTLYYIVPQGMHPSGGHEDEIIN